MARKRGAAFNAMVTRARNGEFARQAGGRGLQRLARRTRHNQTAAEPPQATTAPAGRLGLADLQATVDSGEKSSKRLTRGQNADVHLVTYNNGTRAVRKRMSDAADIVGPDMGHPKTMADAEVLTSRLADAIGAPVPRVLRTGPTEVVIEYVPGGQGDDLDLADQADIVASPAGVRLGTLDMLIGGWDRAHNWLATPDGPVGIDHAFVFYDEADSGDPPALWALSPFSVHFVSSQPGAPDRWRADQSHEGTTAWSDNPLTPADIEWLRGQLDSVRRDFTAAGRHDWFEFVSERLDAIAPHARGRESRFAQ